MLLSKNLETQRTRYQVFRMSNIKLKRTIRILFKNPLQKTQKYLTSPKSYVNLKTNKSQKSQSLILLEIQDTICLQEEVKREPQRHNLLHSTRVESSAISPPLSLNSKKRISKQCRLNKTNTPLESQSSSRNQFQSRAFS